jgi:hypothetical protein
MEPNSESNKSYYVILFKNAAGTLEALDKKFDDLEKAHKACKTHCVVHTTQCYVARIVFEAHTNVCCASGDLD